MIKLFADGEFGIDPSDLKSVPQHGFDNSSVQNILQLVFGIAGGVAVIILMIAALKYVTSQGDPTAVGKAKNTIINALIGLAVCAAAFTIVTFVVTSL